jgi:hypothetical protein
LHRCCWSATDSDSESSITILLVAAMETAYPADPMKFMEKLWIER